MKMWSILFILALVNLTVTEAQDACGGGNRTDPSGYFQTMNFPNPYSLDADCTWTIDTAPGTIVVLRFFAFDVEDHYDCDYDRLSVYDGLNHTAQLIGEYCTLDNRFPFPNFIRSSGDALFMRFVSDHRNNRNGFSGVYWSSRECSTFSIDLIFVIEISTLSDDNLERVKTLMKSTLFGLDIDGGLVRVGVITSNGIAFDLWDFDTTRDVFKAIDDMRADGGATILGPALREVRDTMLKNTSGARPDAQDIVILVIESDPTGSTEDAFVEAEALRNMSVMVRVVGTGDEVRGAAESLSSDPKNENHFLIGSYPEMANVTRQAYYPLCFPGRPETEINGTASVLRYRSTHSFSCIVSVHEDNVESYIWYTYIEGPRYTATSVIDLEFDIPFMHLISCSFVLRPYTYFTPLWIPHRTAFWFTFFDIVQVEVTVTDDNPYPASFVTLTCLVTLLPIRHELELSYRWSSGEFNSSTLTVQALTDAQYTCEAATKDDPWTRSLNVQNVTLRELPAPNVTHVAKERYIFGRAYQFNCSSPVQGVEFSKYLWEINNMTKETVTSERMILMSQPVMRIKCATDVESHVSPYSLTVELNTTGIQSLNVHVSNNNPYPGLFVTLTCNATVVPAIDSSEVGYRWSPGGSSNRTLTFQAVMDDQYTCEATTDSVLWIRADNFENITIRDLPAPDVINMHQGLHILDQSYMFNCSSPVQGVEFTNYLWEINNVTNETSTNGRMITMSQSVMDIKCATKFQSHMSPYSVNKEVETTAIISITAQASDHRYPGTWVTLDCLVTLVSGFTESDVNFWWVEEDRVVAFTKTRNIYITTGMDKVMYCKASSGVVNRTTDPLNITALNLPAPGLSNNNESASGIYELGYTYTLTCHSAIAIQPILTSYIWQRDGQMMANTSTHYQNVVALSTTHNYTCTVMVNTEESATSPSIQVKTKSITEVHIENHGQTKDVWRPVYTSVVRLDCMPALKSHISEQPQYKWIEGENVVARTQELFLNIHQGYDSNITCVVTVGDDMMEADPVRVIGQASPMDPDLKVAQTQFTSGSQSTFQCDSDALSLNTSFAWFKDSNRILCAEDSSLHITRLNPQVHSGQYYCQVSAIGDSFNSTVKDITVEDV